MHSIQLHSFLDDVRSDEKADIFIVGQPQVIILYDYYSKEQYWFDFVVPLIHKSEKLAPSEPLPRISENRRKRPRIIPTDPEKIMYPQDSEYKDQYVLPFAEFRRITHSQFARLKAFKFPTFERTHEGKIAQFVMADRKNRNDALTWCFENCQGRFHVEGTEWTFEWVRDATLAKMWFG